MHKVTKYPKCFLFILCVCVLILSMFRQVWSNIYIYRVPPCVSCHSVKSIHVFSVQSTSVMCVIIYIYIYFFIFYIYIPNNSMSTLLTTFCMHIFLIINCMTCISYTNNKLLGIYIYKKWKINIYIYTYYVCVCVCVCFIVDRNQFTCFENLAFYCR